MRRGALGLAPGSTVSSTREDMLHSNAYHRVFVSGGLMGAGAIIKKHLQLPDDHVLAMTVPHGVDVFLLRQDIDLHSYEPVYLTLRPDIAERVAHYKKALLFPHPWLLLDDNVPDVAPAGTLFIGPPPANDSFKRMFEAMEEAGFPKPWALLLKDRGLEARDFDWWRSRGVEVQCAGSILEPSFYYNLRDILSRYALIASPSMSSAVVFAASLGKPVKPLPGIKMSLIETADIEQQQDFEDRDGNAKQVWTELLSGDPARSQRQALLLLGAAYLAPPAELRARYLDAVAHAGKRIHLHPLRSGPLLRVLDRLIRMGLPMHKFFPSPWRRVRERIKVVFGRNWLTVIEGSDLAHYGIAGASGRFRIYRARSRDLSGGPGFAVRTTARGKSRLPPRRGRRRAR